jgi:hypothetical protein
MDWGHGSLEDGRFGGIGKDHVSSVREENGVDDGVQG